MTITVHAECRPTLRACNFFVKTSTVDLVASVVTVDRKLISINYETGFINIRLPECVTLVPASLSGLIVSGNALSCRTQIADFASPKLDRTVYTPNFQSEDSVKFSCEFCKQSLSDSMNFKRVLPLPSCEETNDFFCHRHSNKPISLDPGLSDYFFNHFFSKVNALNLNVAAEGDFSCPNCKNLLGEVQGSCVKLWNSAINLTGPMVDSEDDSLGKFLTSLKYFLKDMPLQMNKFILTSSDDGQNCYTLLWILDRHLNLLTGSSQSDDVTLLAQNAVKLLYSHHRGADDVTEEWSKSCNSTVLPVHPVVARYFLKYLAAQSENIPSDSNVVNGMNVSYVR